MSDELNVPAELVVRVLEKMTEQDKSLHYAMRVAKLEALLMMQKAERGVETSVAQPASLFPVEDIEVEEETP